MANSNFDAARALANALGAPQPTPQGRDMAQQIAVAFNTYAGSDVIDVQRAPPRPTSGTENIRPDFWNDPKAQKVGAIVGVFFLALWLMSRKHHED